jgi:hypothetical protein
VKFYLSLIRGWTTRRADPRSTFSEMPEFCLEAFFYNRGVMYFRLLKAES